MKKLLLLASMTLMMVLVACGVSEEAEELVDYHNTYVDTVNEKAMLVDAELQNSLMVETPEEALELQAENVLPLVEEIEEFISTRDPQTEVVKELHDMRVEQLAAWSEAVKLRYQALEKAVEDATEEEINELLILSDEKLLEAQEKGMQADNRFREMADEHDVIIEEE